MLLILIDRWTPSSTQRRMAVCVVWAVWVVVIANTPTAIWRRSDTKPQPHLRLRGRCMYVLVASTAVKSEIGQRLQQVQSGTRRRAIRPALPSRMMRQAVPCVRSVDGGHLFRKLGGAGGCLQCLARRPFKSPTNGHSNDRPPAHALLVGLCGPFLDKQ